MLLKEKIYKFHDQNVGAKDGVFQLPKGLYQWSEFIEAICTLALKIAISQKLRLVLKSIISSCNIVQEIKIERDQNRNK